MSIWRCIKNHTLGFENVIQIRSQRRYLLV